MSTNELWVNTIFVLPEERVKNMDHNIFICSTYWPDKVKDLCELCSMLFSAISPGNSLSDMEAFMHPDNSNHMYFLTQDVLQNLFL